MKPLLDITDVSLSYHSLSGETPALSHISFDLMPQEFLAIVGPSGCGKSTVLRMLGGLEQISSGEVILDGKVVNKCPPVERDIAIVFQDYALYSNMSVYENVGISMKVQHEKDTVILDKVLEAADTVEITEYLNRLPKQLSGGQKQRVALARTLTQNPRIILADEPVAALDPVTAKQVMQDFVRINEEMGISILLNIHHVELALEYADRIIGIRAGKIVYDGPSANVDQSVLDAIYGDDSETEADA